MQRMQVLVRECVCMYVGRACVCACVRACVKMES